MNRILRIHGTLAVASLLGIAQATAQSFVFSSALPVGGVVPDGNLAGWADSRAVSGLAFSSIGTVKVSLQVSGGFSGDLYAFLSNGSSMAVLLNRPGVTASDAFGYADGGLSVVFADDAAHGDIHQYQAVVSYASLIASAAEFEPDGRAVSPLTVTDASAHGAGLGAAFAGTNPNATWTLFLADTVTGGGSPTVTQWGLEFTPAAVPEAPATCVSAALTLGAFAAVRRRWQRRTEAAGKAGAS